MFDQELEQFICDYVKELEAGTAAVFAGAGLSASSGFVNWAQLLEPLARQLNLDAHKDGENLVALAQYYVNNEGGSKSDLQRRLLEEFAVHADPHENHRIIARLPIPVYWTTNYDQLIEQSLRERRRNPDVKSSVDQLSFSLPRRDAIVFKMHGDIGEPSKVVLTRDDYERYSTERAPFVTALSGDLVSRTFLFLGFSFTDPNLDYVLSRIRMHFSPGNTRKHFALFRRVQRSSFSSDEAFIYARTKQTLAITDLKRFNIKALLVDEYVDITQVLQQIEKRYRRKTIFISGSADEFGRWARDDVEEFLHSLGRSLIQKGYRIVSGFGLGISNALISGAIETLHERRLGRFEDFLTVRPFPRHFADPDKRTALWTNFRNDMIGEAGVAMFLFGNKSEGGRTVDADGVAEEFEIASSLGLDLVPVASTGYMARALADTLIARPEPPPYSDDLRTLAEEHGRPQELLEPLLQILDRIAGR